MPDFSSKNRRPAPAVLVPAAGASSRMGGEDKLLKQIDGEPLLRRMVARCLALGGPVLVTLPPARPERAEALRGLPEVTLRTLADAATGMSASLREGAAFARAQALDLIVVLPDMPDIETADLQRLVEARSAGAPILRGATVDGRSGHPVLFSCELLAEFEALTGDRGAAPVIAARESTVELVPLKGQRACRDLDTPADWAAYFSERS